MKDNPVPSTPRPIEPEHHGDHGTLPPSGNVARVTPGPWKASDAPDGSGIPGWNIFGADGWCVCSMMDANAKAIRLNPPNARLIAAAPELLEELKALAEWADRHALPTLGDDTDGGNACVASARAAIAKAEGRQ